MRLPDSRAAKFLSTPSARRATFAEPSSFRVVQFLSTPSARRATDLPVDCHGSRNISIHALREEGDATRMAARARLANFYPRPPRGGRPKRQWPRPTARTISIHALREEGDPEKAWRIKQYRQISIHALREEGDRQHDFHVWRIHDISIHALREEGDACVFRPFR